MKLESSSHVVTEMEGGVIAIIAEYGPMTAYAIKEVFRASPSSFWSGSAGAVYPLVKRLEAKGLLASSETSESRRPKREFRLTSAGEEALTVWLTDVERAVNVGYDPLRTRAQFSHLLDTDAREAFFDAVSAAVPEAPAPGGASPRLLGLHEAWIRARLAWLSAFRKQSGDD